MREVSIVTCPHRPEAEMLAEMLEQHGVIARIARAPGSDVPDFMSGGAHILYVRADQAEFAREMLTEFEHDDAYDDLEPDDEFLERLDALEEGRGSYSSTIVIVAVILVCVLLLPVLTVVL